MYDRKIINHLSDCIVACNYCATACAEEEMNMEACIKQNLHCAAVCEALLKVLSQKSKNITTLLNACIEECERCEAECRKHKHDHCQECADVCKACLEACRSLAA